MVDRAKPHPGFQESRRTGAEVTLYASGDDPVLPNAQGKIECTGRANAPDEQPTLLSVQVSKTMGAPAGNFTLEMKCPQSWGRTEPSLLQRVVDDDWLDISFTIHGEKWHWLRGQVEEIRETTAASGAGATTRTYALTGRDFGRIFDMTSIWFNRFIGENSFGDIAIQLAGAVNSGGNPTQTVELILKKFLGALASRQRATWQLPPGMPRGGGRNFVDVLGPLADVDFNQEPKRFSVGTQFVEPGGVQVWGMAQEWSDPMFCELFTDLGRAASLDAPYLDPETGYTPEETEMKVFFRERPFPNLRDGRGSLWFRLPMVEVHRQMIAQKDVGRSGHQRYNNFVVSPNVTTEQAKIDLIAPLWNTDDVKRHGNRLFTVESRYTAANNDLLNMSTVQRALARDWHCMNPYLLNGSISFAALVPNLRIGMRLRIVGDTVDTQETYYVEQVSHSWSLQAGGRTTAVVTRGWVGTDSAYLDAMQTIAARYSDYRTVLGDFPSTPPRGTGLA